MKQWIPQSALILIGLSFCRVLRVCCSFTSFDHKITERNGSVKGYFVLKTRKKNFILLVCLTIFDIFLIVITYFNCFSKAIRSKEFDMLYEVS